MNQQSEQARELLAKQRQQGDRRQQALHERVEEELHHTAETATDAKARAAVADQRLDRDQTQATMRERSEEELKRP